MSGSSKPEGVLGISLGTRAVGIAVVLDGSLAYWRIKTFWAAWSEDKQAAIIGTILTIARRYAIATIAVKSPTHGRLGNLQTISKELLHAAETGGIACYALSIHDLKLRHSKDYFAHRNIFFEKLLEKYPQLQTIKPGKKGRTTYHDKLFEAIECAQYAIETGL